MPASRDQFQVGIAAHAVLEAVVTETTWKAEQLSQEEVDTLARETVARLVGEGRTFDGAPEPPMRAEDALAGRDLAVAHLAAWWPTPGSMAELGIAVDRDWKLVEYDSPSAWLRCIVDYASVEECGDEESAVSGVIVRDFKTAWTAGEGELDTLQRRVQAALAFIAFRERSIGLVRMEVANLRTGGVFSRDLWLSDEGESFAALKADLGAVIRPMENWTPGKRPAIPGAHCLGCPYVLACDWAASWIEDSGIPGTPENRARAYAAGRAHVQALAPILRAETLEQPIDIPGGRVGYVAKEVRRPALDAYAKVAAEWGVEDPAALGLLKAIAPPVGAIEAVAKILYPERTQRADRLAFVESLVRIEKQATFDVYTTEGDHE